MNVLPIYRYIVVLSLAQILRALGRYTLTPVATGKSRRVFGVSISLQGPFLFTMFHFATQNVSLLSLSRRCPVAFRSFSNLTRPSGRPLCKASPPSLLSSYQLFPRLAHPRLHSSLSIKEETLDSIHESEEEGYDFGSYSVILPPEPFVFGVGHIRARSVPNHISLPPYVASLPLSQRRAGVDERPFNGDPYTGDGRIELGSEAESRLRTAAKLAKKTLVFAGSLVKVGQTTYNAIPVLSNNQFSNRLGSLLRLLIMPSMTSSCRTVHIRPLSSTPASPKPAARVSITLLFMGFQTSTIAFA